MQPYSETVQSMSIYQVNERQMNTSRTLCATMLTGKFGGGGIIVWTIFHDPVKENATIK